MFTLQGHIKGSRNDQFRAWRKKMVIAAHAAQQGRKTMSNMKMFFVGLACGAVVSVTAIVATGYAIAIAIGA